MRYRVALALAALPLTALAACGSDSSTTSSTPVTIPVTISGNSISTPNSSVDVSIGQDVTLQVTADAAGQIHVHSSPEQLHNYSAGSTTIDLGSFKIPGQIDVESHALDKQIVTLVVE
jgi:hypothetical protein